MAQQYDYIILGAGAAGLSLAVRLANDPWFASKRILLIDREPKTRNDRTWCVWERGAGYFEELVHHRWQQLHVRHYQGQLPLQLKGYEYKLIRGIDFYKHAFATLAQAPHIQVLYDAVQQVEAATGLVHCANGSYQATHIFSSVLLQEPAMQPTDLYLLQHFRGWWVETDTDCFDPATADLMNFRTSQQHGCAFVYVLPVSKRRALIEYTLFTEDSLTDEQYDEGLRLFMTHEMQLSQYRITEVENGIIPMTNLRFPGNDGRIVFIGTAGGQTKASTGYTFQYIQKHSQALLKWLKQPGTPLPQPAARFRFYDTVLLRVLHERRLPGADVFFRLFQNNPADRVFRFLDNESNFWEELLLMNSTPKGIFVPAALASLRG